MNPPGRRAPDRADNLVIHNHGGIKMQKRIEVLFMAVILAALATAALAQGGPAAGRGTPTYNPKTEVRLTGSIEDVQQQPCMGGHTGTHIMLKTQSETDEVCVGPATYIQQKGFSFTKGDQVEVIGSNVKFDGKDVVVARQITKEKQVLTLRDAQGIPAWSGGRRRSN